jgi:hypothetical protein
MAASGLSRKYAAVLRTVAGTVYRRRYGWWALPSAGQSRRVRDLLR